VTWGKLHAGAVDDRKFDLIAERADTTALAAWGVFSSAWDHALQHGGDLGRLSLELVAHRWRLAIAEVERIWREMVRLGIVVGDELRAWAERQAKPPQGSARAYSQRTEAVRKRAQRAANKAGTAAPDVPRGTSGGTAAGTCPPSPCTPTQEIRFKGPPLPPRGDGGDAQPRFFNLSVVAQAGQPATAEEEPAPDTIRPQQIEILLPVEGGRPRGERRRETRSQRRNRELAEHQAERERWLASLSG
jgi:hypothetical protein